MPIPLRADFDAQLVRSWARRSKDGPQARRLLALAAIYEGATRTQAARLGGVTLQIVRDWVMKFNAQGPEGLIDRKPPGQPSRLNDTHRAALAAIIESGPIPAVHGVVRWRIVDLLPMDLRRIPRRRRQADVEPPIARHGISQPLGSASPLRSGSKRDRGF
jgi:transposase